MSLVLFQTAPWCVLLGCMRNYVEGYACEFGTKYMHYFSILFQCHALHNKALRARGGLAHSEVEVLSKFSALKWYLIVHYAVQCSLHAIVYSVASAIKPEGLS